MGDVIGITPSAMTSYRRFLVSNLDRVAPGFQANFKISTGFEIKPMTSAGLSHRLYGLQVRSITLMPNLILLRFHSNLHS